MNDPLIHLARAMHYQSKMWADGAAPGKGQASLRQLTLEMTEGDIGQIAMKKAAATRDRLMSITIPDMPASSDDLALLIDTIAFRFGYFARADAWRHIGINPNRGRDLLGRGAGAIDWPIWFTARESGLGDR